MLIAGCVWLGAKERGAFGFSNEKSLMYCPSTLSCAWPCGALALGAGPPLPPVVAIDSTSHCPQLPQSAAWLTQAPRSDKDITRGAWTYANCGTLDRDHCADGPGTARPCELCRPAGAPPTGRRRPGGRL